MLKDAMMIDPFGYIAFNKVKEPYGWLGNMSPYPIVCDGEYFRTSEHLYQAMKFIRFGGDWKKNKILNDIVMEIADAKSPMVAKWIAHKHHKHVTVRIYKNGYVGYDLFTNMSRCLKMKIVQNKELRQMLLDTGTKTIIEDCSGRKPSPWGAQFKGDDWYGENKLGICWMNLRTRIREYVKKKQQDDLYSRDPKRYEI